jgi:hypothetical protein
MSRYAREERKWERSAAVWMRLDGGWKAWDLEGVRMARRGRVTDVPVVPVVVDVVDSADGGGGGSIVAEACTHNALDCLDDVG